jgi:glycine betaine/proline transport system ATP-binding protein
VALGLELDGMSRTERRERVASQLELVGLAGWGEKRVDELSGGMQQRVGLARAFATSAPILLMDEPFSALDPLIRVRLQDELLELQRKLNRTVIFVSHDLDEALKIGSRIAIMESGEIVQIGTPQEIVLDPCSDYVREFVAHMNPLNVLRAQEIMVPQRPATDDGWPGGLAASDQSGEATPDGTAAPVVAIEQLDGAPHGALIAVERETPLRALIHARLTHRGPFLVRDGGVVCGMIGDEQLFRCLVHAGPPAEGEPGSGNAAKSGVSIGL